MIKLILLIIHIHIFIQLAFLKNIIETRQQQLQKKLVRPYIICKAKGFKMKFRRFTKDAEHKAIQHKMLDST